MLPLIITWQDKKSWEYIEHVITLPRQLRWKTAPSVQMIVDIRNRAIRKAENQHKKKLLGHGRLGAVLLCLYPQWPSRPNTTPPPAHRKREAHEWERRLTVACQVPLIAMNAPIYTKLQELTQLYRHIGKTGQLPQKVEKRRLHQPGLFTEYEREAALKLQHLSPCPSILTLVKKMHEYLMQCLCPMHCSKKAPLPIANLIASIVDCYTPKQIQKIILE